MNNKFILVIGLLCYLNSYAQDEWELKRDKDSIIIYTRESKDSPLKEYLATAIIESSIDEVFQFLSDLEYRPAWVVRCTGLEIIDTTAGNLIRYHTGYDIPWPLADRDLVVVADLSYDEENRKARLLTIHTDIQYPLEKGIVRMPRYREDVVLEELSPTHTRFRAEGFADPGGNVPAWLVNMFLVDGIYDSVISTRKNLLPRQK